MYTVLLKLPDQNIPRPIFQASSFLELCDMLLPEMKDEAARTGLRVIRLKDIVRANLDTEEPILQVSNGAKYYAFRQDRWPKARAVCKDE